MGAKPRIIRINKIEKKLLKLIQRHKEANALPLVDRGHQYCITLVAV